LPSPQTTGANCSSTSYLTYRGLLRKEPRVKPGGLPPCA
jgi:hypothetical protein